MSRKIKLIEYDNDIYHGDEIDPDIQFRTQLPPAAGPGDVPEKEQAETDMLETIRRIEDMRSYAKAISSSSSESSSSSFSSSSISAIKSKYLGDPNIRGICFSPDGTKFYCVMTTGYPTYIWQFSLSVAWDIDTLVLVSTKNVSGYGLLGYGGRGLGISNDGTMLYIGGDYLYPDGYIQGHPLSTAWDIASIESNTQFLWFNGYARSIRFSDDGDYMYVMSLTTDSPYSAVLEYTLISPWYITDALQSQITSMESYDHDCYGICFESDGGRMMVMGNSTGKVYFWSLPIAWRLIGETKDATELDIDSLIGGTQKDIFCTPDGGHIFMVDGRGYIYDFESL